MARFLRILSLLVSLFIFSGRLALANPTAIQNNPQGNDNGDDNDGISRSSSGGSGSSGSNNIDNVDNSDDADISSDSPGPGTGTGPSGIGAGTGTGAGAGAGTDADADAGNNIIDNIIDNEVGDGSGKISPLGDARVSAYLAMVTLCQACSFVIEDLERPVQSIDPGNAAILSVIRDSLVCFSFCFSLFLSFT